MKKFHLNNFTKGFLRLVVFLALLNGFNLSAQLVNNRNSNTSNASWGRVGFGGGGAMFNPAVSPHNPDYAFVSCDMGGSYVTHDGGQSWRMFNLRGSVDFYVFDPLDPQTVYANSLALYKSTDRGATWKVVYPRPSDIVGLVSKGDHAQEVVITKDSTRRKVLAFAVDPANSKKLYAAISIDRVVGFFTSADGGSHWTMEHPLTDGAKNIFVLPSSAVTDRSVYITGNTTVTVKEKGQWKVNPGPAGVSKVTEYSGGFDINRKKLVIYCISGKSYFNPKGDKSGIWFSENGGASWENREMGLTSYNIKTAEIPEWRAVATSALHPEVVYVSYNSIKILNDTSCIGVAVSKDFGKTWQLAWKDILSKNGNKPSANFKTAWLEDRFGPGWPDNPFSIGVSPTNPAVSYGTDFGRTVKTSNAGKTWEQVYSQKVGDGWRSRGLDVTTGYSVLFDPFDKKNMYMCNTDIGLMKSKDGGTSWFTITKNNGIPRKWQNSTYWLAFDPAVKDKAWAAMSGTHDLPRPKMWIRTGISNFTGGIVQTEDGGQTWKPLTVELGEVAITHLLLDETSPKETRTIYACAFGKGVYKSADGGKTWQLKNKGIAGKEPFAWRMFRRNNDGALFLIVSRRSEDGSIGNEMDGTMYRSDDKAETWQPIALPVGTNGPTSLLVDQDNSGRMLLSAWGKLAKGKFSPDTGGGIFLSENDGQSWAPVLVNDQHIHDITYDPRINTYYACGFNGSAYRSEDAGKTWKRIKGYNFKWGKRVDLDERDPSKIYVITFGGGVWYGPAKGDEGAVEDIVTPVLSFGRQ